MAAQKGSELLLKVFSGGNYVTVGGLRSTSLTMNDEPVDITTKDSAGVRTLLAQGGVRSVSVSGSGVFMDDAADLTIRGAVGGASFLNWQVIVPGFGTFQGPFMIASLEYAGEYNGEVTYSITLESAGTIAFS